MSCETPPASESLDPAAQPISWRRAAGEALLVFAVFFVHGAAPVPEVNEPYYLGKAVHFWNPDWAPGDVFLDSADSHLVFCLTVGWPARFVAAE